MVIPAVVAGEMSGDVRERNIAGASMADLAIPYDRAHRQIAGAASFRPQRSDPAGADATAPTDWLASRDAAGKGNTYNVTVTHDAGESGRQFGDKVIHAVSKHAQKQNEEFRAATRQRLVEANIGGDW